MHRLTVYEQLSCGAVRYPYHDRDGTLLFEVVRYLPKRFEVVSPDNRVYEEGIIPHYVLYRLPELLAADPAETVWYVEGEKDVETLRAAGLVATTNPGGCRHGWREHYAADLRGRHVVVVPDADGPGRVLAGNVVAGLRGRAASAITLQLPIHGRDDVSDWLAARGHIPRLVELATQARYTAAGVSGKPDGFALQRLVFAAALPTLDKLLLLAAVAKKSRVHGVDVCAATVAELAAMAGCHRVTAQQRLTALRGLFRRDPAGRLTLCWEYLAAIVGTAAAAAETPPPRSHTGVRAKARRRQG